MSKIAFKDIFANIIFAVIGGLCIWFATWAYEPDNKFLMILFSILGILAIIFSFYDGYKQYLFNKNSDLLNDYYKNKDILNLLKLAKNKSEIQERSIRYLGALKDKEAIETLKEIIIKNEKENITVAAIESLSLIDDKDIEEFLSDLLVNVDFQELIFPIAIEHMKIKGIDGRGYEILKKMKIDDELDEWEEADFDEIYDISRIDDQVKANFENYQDVINAVDTIQTKELKQIVINYLKSQEQNLISLQKKSAKQELYLDEKKKIAGEMSRLLDLMNNTDDPVAIEKLSSSIEKLQNSYYKQKEFFWKYGLGRILIEVAIGILIAVIGGLIGSLIG